MRTKGELPPDTQSWTGIHDCVGVPSLPRVRAYLDFTNDDLVHKGIDVSTVFVDLKQSPAHKPWRVNRIGAVTNRAEWFSFRADRMLVTTEYAELMGFSDTCGLDPKFFDERFGNSGKAKHVHGLGNGMALNCVGLILGAIGVSDPHLFESNTSGSDGSGSAGKSPASDTKRGTSRVTQTPCVKGSHGESQKSSSSASGKKRPRAATATPKSIKAMKKSKP
jgi:hypothetical protein